MGSIKEAVREQYKKVADGDGGCCGTSSCCSSEPNPNGSEMLGYSEKEMSSVPEGANLGLGCGNPQAIASLKPGETVLDLGSGGGFDCFLAAKQVGKDGTVIGVDMTAEMIDRARQNAEKSETENVEFRLGEIEHLPVADAVVDVILSNCVINLSPDKAAVFREAFRVLKHGGRLAISDVVATASLPDDVRENMELYVGCIAGAASIDQIQTMLADAGFVEIKISPKADSREFIREWVPGGRLEDYVVSATIEAVRP